MLTLTSVLVFRTVWRTQTLSLCMSYCVEQGFWTLLIMLSCGIADGSLRVLLQVFGVSGGRLLLHVLWVMLRGCWGSRVRVQDSCFRRYGQRFRHVKGSPVLSGGQGSVLMGWAATLAAARASFSCWSLRACRASHSSISLSKSLLSASTYSFRSGGSLSKPLSICPVSLSNSSEMHRSMESAFHTYGVKWERILPVMFLKLSQIWFWHTVWKQFLHLKEHFNKKKMLLWKHAQQDNFVPKIQIN